MFGLPPFFQLASCSSCLLINTWHSSHHILTVKRSLEQLCSAWHPNRYEHIWCFFCVETCYCHTEHSWALLLMWNRPVGGSVDVMAEERLAAPQNTSQANPVWQGGCVENADRRSDQTLTLDKRPAPSYSNKHERRPKQAAIQLAYSVWESAMTRKHHFLSSSLLCTCFRAS